MTVQNAMHDALTKFETTGGNRAYFQRFSVNFEFPVYFSRDIFCVANRLLRDVLSVKGSAKPPKVAFFVDTGIAEQMPDLARRIEAYAQAHADSFTLAGGVQFVAGGEGCKNDMALVEQYQRHVVDLGIDRHSYVVAVGGGAVLDLIGYVAATTHRGLRHIRVPTTVLSQNDSGVGVKNGVNGFGVKNLIGTFEPPSAVINDSAFIDVLPGRDKRAGMAEAVKVALIRDANFFTWIEEQAEALAIFTSEPLDYLIRHCAMLHMRQIAHGGDPFERGSARPLDFGHWAAHRLETLANYDLRHGEAVAIGIAMDTRYSVLAGLLPPGDDERVRRLLERLGFSLWHPACALRDESGKSRLLGGLEQFREHLGGELTITLLSQLGTGVEVHEMDEAMIGHAIDWLQPDAAS